MATRYVNVSLSESNNAHQIVHTSTVRTPRSSVMVTFYWIKMDNKDF